MMGIILYLKLSVISKDEAEAATSAEGRGGNILMLNLADCTDLLHFSVVCKNNQHLTIDIIFIYNIHSFFSIFEMIEWILQ